MKTIDLRSDTVTLPFARTRLLCLENTMAGKVLRLPYLYAAGEFARRRDLRLHLDGARIHNAAVALNIPVREIAQPFDSVSVCLSKGLAARGILVGDHPGPIRAVTHYGMDAADIDAVLQAAREAGKVLAGLPEIK